MRGVEDIPLVPPELAMTVAASTAAAVDVAVPCLVRRAVRFGTSDHARIGPFRVSHYIDHAPRRRCHYVTFRARFAFSLR